MTTPMDRERSSRPAAGIRIGEPDVDVDAPAHTPGTREGNAEGSYLRQRGHVKDGRSTARRSTGINPELRDPVVPGAPNISPP